MPRRLSHWVFTGWLTHLFFLFAKWFSISWRYNRTTWRFFKMRKRKKSKKAKKINWWKISIYFGVFFVIAIAQQSQIMFFLPLNRRSIEISCVFDVCNLMSEKYNNWSRKLFLRDVSYGSVEASKYLFAFLLMMWKDTQRW